MTQIPGNKKIDELLDTGETQVVVGSPTGPDVEEAIRIVEQTSSRRLRDAVNDWKGLSVGQSQRLPGGWALLFYFFCARF